MLNYLKNNLITGFLLILSLCSLIGAIIYRFYALDIFGVTVSLALALIVFIILVFLTKNKYTQPKISQIAMKKSRDLKKENSTLFYSLLALYFIFFITNILILISSRTSLAIISPWQIINKLFFLTYFIQTILLIIILIFNNHYYKKTINLLLFTIYYLLSFSVALIVYQIGYGFDPFVHEATLDLIDKTGAVAPKPFYYLGYYSLVILIHKISFLSIALINKYLTSLLAALILPAIFYRYLDKNFQIEKNNYLLILMALIIPFSIFIISTPQNLAYLFLIILIFYGLTCANWLELTTAHLIALACFFIHPIAGIPAIFFAILLHIYHSDTKRVKKYLYLLIFLASALVLPLAFYIFGNSNSNSQSNNFASIAPKIDFFNSQKESVLLNTVYLWGFNFKYLLILIISLGLLIAYYYRKEAKILALNALIAASLLISYIILKQLNFSYLIDYERSNFSNRLLVEIVIFLLPFIFLVFYQFIDHIFKTPKTQKIIFLIFISLLLTASLYLSYPRFDHYFNSRGYSTGQSDVDAVQWINNNAHDNFIVLANQQTSAAALNEFGFKKYYFDDIFYYPIPTSGPLYQFYLKMVYERPSKETAKEAMDLTGADQLYFVLNKYWWAFPKILAEAKLEADSFKVINDDVYIFLYEK